MESIETYPSSKEGTNSGGNSISMGHHHHHEQEFAPLAPDYSSFVSAGSIQSAKQQSRGFVDTDVSFQSSFHEQQNAPSTRLSYSKHLEHGVRTGSSNFNKTSFYHIPRSSSQGRLNYQSHGHELLTGLAAMQAKIRSLERSQKVCSSQFSQLQKATDVYTGLLQNGNVGTTNNRAENVGKMVRSISAQTGENFYELQNEGIKHDTELKNLENRSQELIKRLSRDYNANSGPVFSRLSDDLEIEKLRHGSGEGTKKSRRKNHPGASHKSPLLTAEDNPPQSGLSFNGSNVQQQQPNDGIPVAGMDFSLDATIEGQMRPVSIDASSTGSSVRLNDRQRDRLSAYRDQLLGEMRSERGVKGSVNTSLPVALGQPKEPSEEKRPKHRTNNVSGIEKRTEETEEKSEEIDFSALRERLARLKDDVIQKRKDSRPPPHVLKSKELQVSKTNVISLGKPAEETRIQCEPISPCRKLAKKDPPPPFLLKETDFRQPPFVAAKSTTASFSVNVNLQQLLAVLKTQNPILHSLCLRLGPNTPTRELAKAFRYELARSIEKAERKLDQQLKLYDDVCDKLNLSVQDDVRRKLEIERSSLAARIEQEDLVVHRMQQQYAKLYVLLSTDPSGQNDAHRCKLNSMKTMSLGKGPRMKRNHIREHTVSSFSKSADRHGLQRSPHKVTDIKGGNWLRDLRQLQAVLAAETLEKPMFEL